ncbi:ABC transporter ATP-binding protein [Kaistia nematophila]|uniref:Sn-glycerol-3-phosphate ABC transporter ATP-binding protein UgpC n=1 Tax=Kaistia nematophila TaxID=2994654 RepID=A0A9X3E4F6_9HYPH|nr:sn-glycerol-3-phosphate ABC transporter ATP-binding protein UgpC [Kaistia nematophila]MCX5569518.1 sn-glycerol-3-phosphate ABC transporter ATP-binding protein UgpC [Kaistia nematophila]
MAEIVFERVTKRYDDGQLAVNALDLKIADGEFLVLVGPSGCGKSTALRMIAGLEEISDGSLVIDGAIANELSPRDRNIAMVFQSYALYPHLSVAENIGFGLKVRGSDKSEIRAKVEATAKLLELSELLDRKPGRLSGGQRQRVAMGRALVRSPKAFLMDEPLSNLDARLRGQMRAEIAHLQKMTGVTTVYVTHDQVEAMTMGDRVAVMNKGVLQQLAAPRVLYDSPANLFVAGFIGSPPMNLLPGKIVATEAGYALELGELTIALDDAALDARPGIPRFAGQPIIAGIRPEALRLLGSVTPGPSRFSGTVAFVEDLGASLLVHLDLAGASVVAAGVSEDGEELSSARTRLRAVVDGALPVGKGDPICLTVDPARIHLFDAKTEQAIGA